MKAVENRTMRVCSSGRGEGEEEWETESPGRWKKKTKKKKQKNKKKKRKRIIITKPHLIMINVEPKFKFIMFKNISLIRLYPQTYFVNYSFLCSIIPPVIPYPKKSSDKAS